MTSGAGGGRPPKPGGQARGRHPIVKGTIVLYAAERPDHVPLPEPLVVDDEAWLDSWHRMWDTPIATLWLDDDVRALTRLLTLELDRGAWRVATLLSEMRQLEDRYLLNPYSRAQQRVVILDEDKPEEANGDVAWLDDARRRLNGTE